MSRLQERVQIVGGPLTKAVIHRASDNDQPGVEFAYPKVSCRVKPGSLIRTGQVLKTQGEEHFLVCDHSATPKYVTHHLFRCDRQMVWTRPGTATDALTGLQRATGAPIAMGTIYVMQERVRREFTDLTLRISQEQAVVATGSPVQIGDMLDQRRVARLSFALGVRILELHA